MGFFGKLKETIKDFQESEKIKSKMVSKEVAADANRPGIRSLPYKQLITSVADDPRLMEPRKVNKKQREQFIECIRQGRFSYTEVVIVDTCNHIIGTRTNFFGDDSRDYEWRYYAKVADMNGQVYKEVIMSLNEELPFGWTNNYWDEKYQNPDHVDISQYPHAFIVHYYLQQTEYYRILTYDEFANLSSLVRELKVKSDVCLIDDTTHSCWW
ncbi:MAG: hypothetical protein K6E28_01145 [Eubacterium sp.]|nr:hypothetical protein [Eubacterium sp.]